MARKGQLTVIGTQQADSGKDRTVQTATAECHDGNGSIYILYEETGDGGETTKNIIKLKGGVLELTKRGAVNARMVFEPGQEHMTLYATPFGSFPLGVLTDTVESTMSGKELEISAAYSLICRDFPSQEASCQDLAAASPVPQASPMARCKILIKMLFQD